MQEVVLTETTERAADAMARLTVVGMQQGLTLREAYAAARTYLVDRWGYLADLIPTSLTETD